MNNPRANGASENPRSTSLETNPKLHVDRESLVKVEPLEVLVESNPQLVHHLLLMIVSLLQRPRPAHRHALLLQLVRAYDEVLPRLTGFRVFRRWGRHGHVTAIVLQIREFGRGDVLDVMPLGRLRVQVAANIVGHLTVLLTFLRTIVLVALVALVIDTGEYQHVENEEAATDRYRHAQGRRVSGETVLGLHRRVLERQLAGRRCREVVSPLG